MIEYLIYGTLSIASLTAYRIFGYLKDKTRFKLFIFSKNSEFISKFPEYMSVLQFYMDKAYTIIHKDRILVYSSEGFSLPDEMFDTIIKDYVNLVLKLIGPSLEKEFILFYGNRETFYFNLSEYFNTKFDDDEIRKSAINSFMNKDIDEQQPKNNNVREE